MSLCMREKIEGERATCEQLISERDEISNQLRTSEEDYIRSKSRIRFSKLKKL